MAIAWQSLLRPLLWVVLGAWLGALAFFGAGVAPAVLERASSPLAGELVRATLRVLDWSGVAAGVLLAALGWHLRRGPWAAGLPLLLASFCLASQLWVAPAIAAARPGAPENLARPDVGQRFRALHRVSVGLYGATAMGLVGLAVLHGRVEARRREL